MANCKNSEENWENWEKLAERDRCEREMAEITVGFLVFYTKYN